MEESHRQHQITLLQVLQIVQNLQQGSLSSAALSRHANPKHSDPSPHLMSSNLTKSSGRHSVKRRSLPTSSASLTPGMAPGRIPSMLEMDSAVLRELGALYDSQQIHDTQGSPSIHTLGSADEMVILPVPRPKLFLSEDNSPMDSLPGVIREDRRHLSIPQPNRVIHMHSISKSAQAMILESHSDLSPVLKEEDHPRSTWLITTYPKLLYLLVCIPALCHLFLVVGFTMLYPASSVASFNAFTLASQMLYGLLATTCVFLLGNALRSDDLHLATARLHEMSGKEWRKYTVAWCIMLTLFTATQCTEIYLAVSEEVTTEIRIFKHVTQVFSIVSFAISSAVVLLSAYLQSHLLIGLDKSLDCWCCQIVDHLNFPRGVETWNAMQALLKCVGRELAISFVAMQLMASIGFMYFLVSGVAMAFRTDIEECLSSLPLPFLLLVSMRVTAHGADLTEKCRAMPAFVNQKPGYFHLGIVPRIPTHILIDLDRQYLVHFIADSSAGFTVRDVKLTREVFLKQVYIFVAMVSGLISILSRLYL
eukprot:s1414_g12.t1